RVPASPGGPDATSPPAACGTSSCRELPVLPVPPLEQPRVRLWCSREVYGTAEHVQHARVLPRAANAAEFGVQALRIPAPQRRERRHAERAQVARQRGADAGNRLEFVAWSGHRSHPIFAKPTVCPP